jgi:AAA+ ATPase superfamily predicted ATPase
MNIESPVEKKESDQNPFVYNMPVRESYFSNREYIIERILKETITGSSQGNAWITGERRVGKTSLLDYIFYKYRNYSKKIKLFPGNEYVSAAFVFLNTQDIRTREDFYKNMRQCIKTYSDFKIEPLEDPFSNFKNAVKYLLVEQKTYIIFLLDEFDALVESMAEKDRYSADSFITELNKLLEGTIGIKFSCVFAANHTLNELIEKTGIHGWGSPLIVESIELPWFTKKQVKELAKQYLENNSIQFTTKETDSCFKMTQGYPYFVQKLFSIMYDYKQKEPDPKSYLVKVKEEYGKTFKETIDSWGSVGIPPRTREKLKNLVGYLAKDADRTLSVIFKGIEVLLKNL